MGSLPPVGWADVATKADLRALEYRLMTAIAKSESRMYRAYYFGTFGLVIGLSTVPRIAEGIFG